MTTGPVMADINDPGSPAYANKVLSGFVTPTVAPGEGLDFSFNLTNPYKNESVDVMTDINLTVGIYMYATQEESVLVDDSFSHPPLIDDEVTQKEIPISQLAPSNTTRIDLHIETSKKTPHGSYFSQSTYFLRFNLTFHFPMNNTYVVLKSRGWFTDEQWDRVASLEGNDSIVNRTYLKSLGVDGLIPDSSFGVKTPIPKWPLALIVAGAVGLSCMALCNYALDNPGRYPRLEKGLYQLRGKLSEFRSKLKDRRRK